MTACCYRSRVALIGGIIILAFGFFVLANFGTVSKSAQIIVRGRSPGVVYQAEVVPTSSPVDPDYTIPPDDELDKLEENGHMRIYWKYINNVQALCKNIIRVGNLKDGGKEICVDSRYKPNQPCTVYSFGINYLFDFDRAISTAYGCSVYCFDPSMKNDTHRVSDKIMFYKWGIGNKNYVNEKGWQIKTFATIRKELGHTNATIDILKIDVEGDEWNAIPEMISSGALDDVKQISMETHAGRTRPESGQMWGNRTPKDAIVVLRQLYDFGFRIVMRERNFWSLFNWPIGHITNVNEVTMVKV